MSSQAFSSNSSDGIVLKAVIDYSYYLTLLKAEKEQKNFLAKKTAEKVEVPATSADHDSIEQLGEGTSKKRKVEGVSEEDIRKIFKEELKNYFQKSHKTNTIKDVLKKTTLAEVAKNVAPIVKKFVGFGSEEVANGEEQEGAGFVDPDVNPPIVEEEELPNGPPEGGLVTELDNYEPLVNKSDFLKLIGEKWHKLATKLLQFFEEKPMLITWNKNTGEVIVNGDTIPDSNIYSVFRELYEQHPDSNVSGYVTVASLLLDLGLGYLFHRSHLHYFARKRNFKEPEQAGEGLPFYFIGD